MSKNYIEQLKQILQTTGWSQTNLAKEISVTFAALNRWLNKKAVPHPSRKAKIYKIYKERVGILPLSQKELEAQLTILNKERKKHKNIYKILRENQNLRNDLLLELTYNSNAIEGSTLTKKETENIIFDKVSVPDKSYIEHLEATNHAAALNAIFDGALSGPITGKKIKSLHSIIMQGISKDAGKYSKHKRAIRGIDLHLPDPEDIEEEMAYLVRKINRPKPHTVSHIASMHSDFEAIHPFGDGNGRVGRLIMTIQLLDTNYAPCIVENKRKAEYYEVLEFAQKKSETHLTKYVIESIEKGYQLIRKHKK